MRLIPQGPRFQNGDHEFDSFSPKLLKSYSKSTYLESYYPSFIKYFMSYFSLFQNGDYEFNHFHPNHQKATVNLHI